ncbi:porphobilinogen synthase [bacterium]|nr:porphobilinogen synthase [bacterium]
MNMPQRPRRNRRTSSLRELSTETILRPENFVWPVFLIEGNGRKEPISTMPGVFRMSIDILIEEAIQARHLGIPALALFPAIDDSKKDPLATESSNPNGLLPNAIKALKDKVSDLTLITDVAMDPYSCDGHDGLVKNGKILNDETLPILAEMALCQAKAGADMIAPSDMMDGRVGYLRSALDESGFEEVGILAYSAKYCSSLYGPFRQALDSAPKEGDKKTYQLNPANRREAHREAALDIEEGADMIMVKPALSYLDIISDLKDFSPVPVAAYQVSGEYSMLMAGVEKELFTENEAFVESLTSIKRAGADIILSYWAKRFCESQRD